MGGRSGQNINSNLNNFATKYAESIGLKGNDFKIVFENLGQSGGDVSFVQVEGTNIYKLSNEIRINSNVSEDRKQKIIRHELTHVKQSKDNRLYIDGSSGKKGGVYWEGKKHMSLSEYQKVSSQRTGRDRMKYKNLPWEKEAILSE